MSFGSGYFFLATVGAGMTLPAFLALSLSLGVETRRAMPTAIVIGGWASLLPFVAHFLSADAQPYLRLLMMLPGVW